MTMPQQAQTKSRITWTNASTRSVDVLGTEFVYRELGADSGVPVIFLNHLAAELDRWDPRVVDGIASRRRMISTTAPRPMRRWSRMCGPEELEAAPRDEALTLVTGIPKER